MCISYCLRTGRFYWNHFDCEPVNCDQAEGPHPACASCAHHAGGQCGLTRAPLPAGEAGCCHHNVAAPVAGERVEASRETLALLALGPDEPEEFTLIREAIPYRRDASGRLWVEIDALALPLTYGQGTEHLPDEEIDWSGWFEQWPETTEWSGK